MFRFLLILAICFLPLCVKPAFAQQPQPCEPVVMLLDQSLCLSDILAAYDVKDPESLSEAELKSLMRSYIWIALLNSKYGPETLQPSAENLALFKKELKRSQQETYEADKKLSAVIEQKTQTETFDPAIIEELTALQKSLDDSLKLYEARTLHYQNLPEHFAALSDMALETEAQENLERWLTHKALFNSYGGKFIKKYGHFWPIDAYKSFLHDMTENKQIIILDSAFSYVLDDFKTIEAEAENTYDAKYPDVKTYLGSPTGSITLKDQRTAKTRAAFKSKLEALR